MEKSAEKNGIIAECKRKIVLFALRILCQGWNFSVNNVTSSVEGRSSYLKNGTLSVKNGTIIKNCVCQE